MVKEGSQTIIKRDCGSKDYCENFECNNNYNCKCRYCNGDMCNDSSVNLNKKFILESFYLVLISSFTSIFSINF
jgi:hypothetical protein